MGRKNNVGECGLHLNGSEQGQVAGSWENGSENLSFIQGENFLIILGTISFLTRTPFHGVSYIS
jgi:hypothetical protein